MYNVTQAYRTAISGDAIKNRVSGTITLSGGATVTIDDSNIVSGSLSIDNKCVNNSEFCLGSVYVGQMSIALFSTINRYSLYGATVELSYFLTLANNTEEEIPLGVYFVDKAVRTNKLIQLTCYDAMTKLDVTVAEDTWGTPYTLLAYVCEKVNLTLANTEAEIKAMCNGEELVTLQTSRVSTYRDFVSHLSAVLGGFASINRDGELEIRSFHTTSDLSVSARKRTDSTVHDYETYFRAVTARFIAEQNYYPYKEEDEERDTGLTLDMGDIPIVQGLEETKHRILQNILTVLEDIRYTPSEISMVADPSIDLGDRLTLQNVNNTQDSANIIVTAFKWNHHGAESITCNGADTLLVNISDSNTKQIENVQTDVEQKKVVVKTYTNADAITITSTEQNIIRLSWSVFESTVAIFIASINVDMTADGNLVLNYYNSSVNAGSVTKYLPKGKHVVTISNYISSEIDDHVNWVVSAKTEYYQSDSRVQNAKILSIKDWIDHQTITTTENSETGVHTSSFGYAYVEQAVDTTVPSASILAEGIKAIAFAQGMNATTAWDGTLTLTDTISGLITINQPDIITAITETIQSVQSAPTTEGFTDTISEIIMNVATIAGFTDAVSVSNVIESQTVTFNTNGYTQNTSTGIKLKTAYQYNGTAGTIDTGSLVSVQIMTSDKQSIESVVIDCV